jgi:hypothetical protein
MPHQAIPHNGAVLSAAWRVVRPSVLPYKQEVAGSSPPRRLLGGVVTPRRVRGGLPEDRTEDRTTRAFATPPTRLTRAAMRDLVWLRGSEWAVQGSNRRRCRLWDGEGATLLAAALGRHANANLVNRLQTVRRWKPTSAEVSTAIPRGVMRSEGLLPQPHRRTPGLARPVKPEPTTAVISFISRPFLFAACRGRD